MRDPQLMQDLWAECKKELDHLRSACASIQEKNHSGDWPKKLTPFIELRQRLLLLMARIATGNDLPDGKTAWEHVNTDTDDT